MAENEDRREMMEKISQVLMEADSMYLFPHMVADGDAMGSCAALCTMMRALGKKADIIMEDEIPENLAFMNRGYVSFADQTTALETRDLCVALDCSNRDRFPKREHLFFGAGRKTICIDHHVITKDSKYADLNLINPDAAATTEILYDLFHFMNLPVSTEAAEAIYTGIITDTGNFQYTNTTRRTHLIAADLIDLGIDKKRINILVYQSERLQKLKLHTMILNNMELHCNGRFSMAHVTLEMYRMADAKTNESDGINTTLRDIRGVEVAVFVREMHPEEIKVGFRSKDYIDVSEICARLGGGGHRHAAGCTVLKTMEETLSLIRQIVIQTFEEYDRTHASLEIADTCEEQKGLPD